jgi:hypothetical protein
VTTPACLCRLRAVQRLLQRVVVHLCRQRAHLLADIMGEPPSTYGLMILLPMASYMLGNAIAARFAFRFGSLTLLICGRVLCARDESPWVFGAVANKIWSSGGPPGSSDRNNQFLLNPFVSFHFGDGRSLDGPWHRRQTSRRIGSRVGASGLSRSAAFGKAPSVTLHHPRSSDGASHSRFRDFRRK